MGFFKISKFLLILLLSLFIFTVAIDFASFDDSFYKNEFEKYGTEKNVQNASFLHKSVIDFVSGKSNALPSDFNERERQHLLDVRKLAYLLSAGIVFSIAAFSFFAYRSLRPLKRLDEKMRFIGKILLYSGLLSILISGILFLLINSDFSPFFESFHRLFFEKGTYVFDPREEIIVRLYPEGLFMDLGIRIAKAVIFLSAFASTAGIILLIKSKTKRINMPKISSKK